MRNQVGLRVGYSWGWFQLGQGLSAGTYEVAGFGVSMYEVGFKGLVLAWVGVGVGSMLSLWL